MYISATVTCVIALRRSEPGRSARTPAHGGALDVGEPSEIDNFPVERHVADATDERLRYGSGRVDVGRYAAEEEVGEQEPHGIRGAVGPETR